MYDLELQARQRRAAFYHEATMHRLAKLVKEEQPDHLSRMHQALVWLIRDWYRSENRPQIKVRWDQERYA